MRNRVLFAAAAAAAAIGLCALAGCGSSGDSSAAVPRLHWTVRYLSTGKAENFQGDAKTSVPEGERVEILLRARSPKKIAYIAVKGRGQWTCHGSAGNEERSHSERVDEIQHTPLQGKELEFLRHGSNFSDWECGPGFEKPTGHFIFRGEGENFAYETGESRLTICNARGC
jgi:hypothetical protein